MSQEELHHLLNKLKDELEDLESSSEVHKEINTLVADIEEELQELENKIHRESIQERVRNHIERFETEHPNITNILHDLMMKLLSIGV